MPRYVIRISPADVGARVSVRTRIAASPGEPAHTDTIGYLRAWKEGVLRIEQADGSLVTLREDDVVAGRTVPPAPAPKRPG